MTNEEKQKALGVLGIESSIRGQKIEVHLRGEKMPTEKELENALRAHEQFLLDQEKAKETALQKLTDLGLTLDDLRAIGVSV